LTHIIEFRLSLNSLLIIIDYLLITIAYYNFNNHHLVHYPVNLHPFLISVCGAQGIVARAGSCHWDGAKGVAAKVTTHYCMLHKMLLQGLQHLTPAFVCSKGYNTSLQGLGQVTEWCTRCCCKGYTKLLKRVQNTSHDWSMTTKNHRRPAKTRKKTTKNQSFAVRSGYAQNVGIL
jgi:hypothetical protein